MFLVRLGCLLFLLTCLPEVSRAAVTISEVAWMGTTLSANHEWIELYNDGASEVVDGWVLTDGMNLTIPLSGTISAQNYAVLERSNDDSAPGTAFLVYTGALVNTGATLSLRRSDGSLVDQVAGGENWESIGGDNVTKETAQYTKSGWVTAIPTPGANNTTDTNSEDGEEEEETTEEDDTNDGTSGGGGSAVSKSRSATPEPLKTEPSAPTIKIAMEGQVYVNQPVTAKATIGNIGKTVAQSMVREWNFGDLHTTTGESVTHRFAYPGEYIVSVKATYKNFTATDRVVVTVLPLTLSVTKNAAGDVQLHNDAKYEVDVSGYVVTGERAVTIPSGTYLRPKATLTIPHTQLGATSRPILVHDSARRLVAHDGGTPKALEVQSTLAKAPALPLVAAAVTMPPPTTEAFRFTTSATTTGDVSPSVTILDTERSPDPLPGNLQAAAPAAGKTPWYPYVGLVAVIGIALATVVAGRVPVPAIEAVSEETSDADNFPFR